MTKKSNIDINAKTIQLARIHKLPLIAALLAILSGSLVLFGYTFDSDVLKSLLPFWAPMKANAAVCFVLIGSAIVLSDYAPSLLTPNAARLCLYMGQSCAMLTGLIGLLSLAEYAFTVNFGIDELLFRDVIDNNVGSTNPVMRKLETAYPGRIKLEAALSFVLLAVATIHSTKNHWRIISASFGLLVLSLSLASLSSYFSPQLGQFGWFGHGIMRMNAAVLFALLGAAEMLISWQRNILSWSFSKSMTLAFILSLFLLVLIGFNSSRTQFWLQSNHYEIARNEKIETELNSLLLKFRSSKNTKQHP
ncbi:MAG: hypothetical protein K9L22_12535 [Methylococcaceae bacterium]|nr:hypothetical protein [Methylococcaceae bacterium]